MLAVNEYIIMLKAIFYAWVIKKKKVYFIAFTVYVWHKINIFDVDMWY